MWRSLCAVGDGGFLERLPAGAGAVDQGHRRVRKSFQRAFEYGGEAWLIINQMVFDNQPKSGGLE